MKKGNGSKVAHRLSLRFHNAYVLCLLLKLLHKLYTATQSSWAIWVRQRICLASLEGDLDGNHWNILRELLPLYQAITSVSLGNGRSTAFWQDVWHGEESMAERYPALYSHCRTLTQSVYAVITSGLRGHLVTRLSAIAAKGTAGCASASFTYPTD